MHLCTEAMSLAAISSQSSPKLGIGLGAGYLESEHPYRPEPPMMTITDNPQGQDWIKYFNTATKLSAIPVVSVCFCNFPWAER